MLKVTTRPFEPADARAHVDLAADTFGIVPAWQRPRDSVEFVANFHAESNPAGGGRPVHLTTNLERRVDTRDAPWRVRGPRRFDLRPAGTMILPRTTLPDDDSRAAPVITGDGMSF